MFLDLSFPSSTIDKTGPAGTCANFTGFTWQKCLTYNYGYNAALLAVKYATSQGADQHVAGGSTSRTTCALRACGTTPPTASGGRATCR